jgi:hypothetical protein
MILDFHADSSALCARGNKHPKASNKIEKLLIALHFGGRAEVRVVCNRERVLPSALVCLGMSGARGVEEDEAEEATEEEEEAAEEEEEEEEDGLHGARTPKFASCD